MRKRNKVRKTVIAVVIVMLVVGALSLFTYNVKANTEDTTTEEQATTLEVTLFDASDEQFIGNKRVEQMFVLSTSTTFDGTYIVLLEDTQGYLWELEDIDLYTGEDVLVLMCDNNTKDITDDAIIHCWSSID